MSDTTFGILVTPHARERFLDHFPHAHPERVIPTIYREVWHALTDHRRSARVPKWANHNHLDDSRTYSSRYVWDEHETRCYAVIERKPPPGDRSDEFNRTWIVKTVLPRMTDEEVEQIQTLKKVRKREKGIKHGRSQRRLRHD